MREAPLRTFKVTFSKAAVFMIQARSKFAAKTIAHQRHGVPASGSLHIEEVPNVIHGTNPTQVIVDELHASN